MNAIKDVEDWFAANCNGDWEHGGIVKISTIDNPGWALDINLVDTSLEGKTLDIKKIERDEKDWYWCWTEKGVFKAHENKSKWSR